MNVPRKAIMFPIVLFLLAFTPHLAGAEDNAKPPWSVLFSHARETFDDHISPWRTTSVEISRRLTGGTIIGRVNLAERFDNDGHQVEFEAYPILKKGRYAYLNFAYSGADIYPTTRLAAEIYEALPNGFEASVGVRRLRFHLSNVTQYTTTIGKYYRDYWFCYRFSLIPEDTGDSRSHMLSIRRYFNDADNFVTLRVGTGRAFDKSVSTFAVYQLKSRTASLSLHEKLNERSIILVDLGIDKDEIAPGKYRKKTLLGTGIEWRY